MIAPGHRTASHQGLSTIPRLLDGKRTIPDEPFVSGELAHPRFLYAGWLKPVVRESFLYLHDAKKSPNVTGSRRASFS
jgi:hypothetical protein